MELRLSSHQPHNLHDISFLPRQRYLVVLDQSKGVPHDPYLITHQKMHAVPSAAVQHLVINPHDINASPIEQWFTRDQDEHIIEVQDDYYEYNFADLTLCAASLAVKLAVCIKELHFKQLMRDTQTRISDYLPHHGAHLAEVSLIADGYLFSVQDDRPLVLPLTLSDPAQLSRLNALLARHHIDCPQLLATLLAQWPYGYKPLRQIEENVDKFIKQQVILLHGPQHIYLQSPKHHTPILTPEGLGQLAPVLQGRKASYPLISWRLPTTYQAKPSAADLRQLLITGSTASANGIQKLLTHLPQLCDIWQQVVTEFNGMQNINFEPLRKAFTEHAIKRVGGDKRLLGLWWQWLSATIKRPVYDPRIWLRTVPGLQGLWLDANRGVYLVGQISAPKLKLIRQPSIYRWHALRGTLEADTLMPLLDVDFVRMGSLAGRVYPHLFIRLFKELEQGTQS